MQTDKDAVAHTPDAFPVYFPQCGSPLTGQPSEKMPGTTKPPSANTSPLRRPLETTKKRLPRACGTQPFPGGAEKVLKIPLFQRGLWPLGSECNFKYVCTFFREENSFHLRPCTGGCHPSKVKTTDGVRAPRSPEAEPRRRQDTCRSRSARWC